MANRRRIAVMLGILMATAMTRDSGAQSAAAEIASGATFPVAVGATVEFQGVNVEVSFLKAPADQVVVEYARAVPADVKIVTLPTAAGVTICTVYASSDPKKPTECLPESKGRLAVGKPKNASFVRFRIRVPAGVHVAATTGYGDLKAMGITGNLRLYSNNGYVLVYDAGGPGTIDAGIGLLGKLDAVIAKEQKGPSRRRISLQSIGSGAVRVGLPTTVTASYKVATNATPIVDPVFGIEKMAPPVAVGSVGPPGQSDVWLDVDTGIAGQFTLFRAK
jgi:hypothetical protein